MSNEYIIVNLTDLQKRIEELEKYNERFKHAKTRSPYDDEWDKNKQYRDEWIEGAKWQQERMYSEEEVFKIIASLLHTPKLVEESSWEDIAKWFEQFKKK